MPHPVSFFKSWLRIFLPLVLSAVIFMGYLGQARIDDGIEHLIFGEETALRLGAGAISGDLAVTARHLLGLIREKPITETIEAPSPANLKRMADAFASLILRNPGYDQVRWIDETGLERVRINSVDGNPVAVPQGDLQSKADRYFFSDSMGLKPGDIYLSPLALNVEHGQIAVPHRLILRMATPIMDGTGKPRGILIVNLLAKRLFEDFIHATERAAPHMLLLNHQGRWLYSPPLTDEGGFLLGDSDSVGAQFPEAWAHINADASGHWLAADGLWVWQDAAPKIAGVKTQVMTKEPPWKAVSHVPPEDIQAIRLAVWTQTLPVAGMLLAILALISGLWVSREFRQAPTTQRLADDEIKADQWWLAYAVAVASPMLMLLLRQNLPASFGDRPMLLLFVFPITLSAVLGGIGPGIIATAITALCANYFLLAPIHAIEIGSPYDLFQWILLIANGVLISVFSEILIRARRESERRRLQKAGVIQQLHESDERFRQLAERTSDIFWIQEWPDKRISYVNPAFETITGIPVATLRQDSETWINAIHPEDRDWACRAFAASLETNSLNVEYRFVRPDGNIRWVHDIGSPVRDGNGVVCRMVGIVRDITENKRISAELDRHRHHLEEEVAQRTAQLQEAYQILEERAAQIADLYHNAPCGYHSLSGDGVLQTINDTELGWLGYARAEVEGRLRYDQLMAPHCLPTFRENFPKLKASPGYILEVEIDLLCKDGSLLPVLVRATAVFDAEGRFVSTRSTLFDNRERKAREAQIAQLNAELTRRADEAEAATRAKSAFLANMSHEIRTPMNAVLGFCYLLQQRPLEAESLALVRKVHNAGHLLLSLINDILDFSKIEAGHLEIETVPFSLCGLLDDLAGIMVASARDKNLELVITPPLNADALLGDGLRLQQVLVNLIGNAIKFTAQGEVELRVSVESEDERQVNLRFGVRDTGIGISLEQQAVIFSAFSQADGSISRRFGGTGLGLSISQQLVRLMGGNLQVDSEPGKGSEFWFVLPLRRDPHLQRTPAQLSRLELLVADDNDAARAALAVAATGLGWKVDAVDSGEAALMQALARADGERFYDVLLLDWKMPGLDGLGAALAIQRALQARKTAFQPSPIVIMVTAYAHDDLQAQPGLAWVDSVLSKPVTPSTLYNTIAEVLSRRTPGLFPAPSQPAAVNTRRIPGVRVLVVDDSIINLEVAQGILESEGASVYLAGDGQKALDWLQANPDAVDIVLMDVQMPLLDGYAATRRIREEARWKSLPVIALTAGAFETLRDAAIESGMNDFLAKPFNVEQMMALIQRWTGCKPEAKAALSTAPPSPRVPLASPPEPEAIPPVPSLPGIDLQKGLKLWGKPDKHRTFLHKFVGSYARAGLEIAAFCREGNTAAAAALAHKLLGVAGSMALPRVEERVRQLDAQLNAGQPDWALADALQMALDEVCASLAEWMAQETPAPANQPGGANINGEAVAVRVKQLLHALDHSNPGSAESVLAQMQGHVDATRLAEIQARLNDFDFQAAETLAKSLLNDLNLTTKG